MAISISILIVVIGLISLFSLPVEQYPDIAPPTVQVSATYTGADAEAVMNSVIMPLEESINGVEDMMYITSTATNAGTATIEVYFKQGTDPDMAAVNVQNRVSKAQGLLPAEVTKIGVTTQKRQTSFLQINALASTDGRYDKIFLGNYMDINVIPQIKRVEGVGDVMMLGDTYSMRIWLHPERMAQYGLVPSDVTAVLGEQNIEAPTGSLGENSKNVFQFTMKYRGRLKSVDEFRNTVVRAQADGSVLRLKDVADVELGTQTYSFSSEMDGKPAVMFIVFQTAGSNATAVNESISKKMKEMEKDLPQGTEFVNMMSSNDFLFASIHNVVETLVIAIILVVLVVYFFLQDFKSTLIPSISIIVSLIGTFACLMAAGFSINILTLFALVLAIGTVVDDAIVVVEAVQAKFDEGYQSPYTATVKAMGGISSALVTTSLVFMSVFIPVCFVGGTTGTFYMQFGITMAVAVGISLVNALTLSPALCALLMIPHHEIETGKKLNFSSRFRKAFNTSFSTLLHKYEKGVSWFMHRKWLTAALLAVACVALFVLIRTTKTGLIPNEDQGTVFVNVSTAPGSNLSETLRIMDEVEKRVATLPQVERYAKVTGYGMVSGNGPSTGMMIVKLKHWDERTAMKDKLNAVIGQLYGRMADIKAAKIMIFAPPMIMGYGNTNSVELYVQDKTGGSTEKLQAETTRLIDALSKRPEVSMAFTSFDTRYPQYRVEVDAVQCKKNGVSPAEVLSTLSGYMGGNYASNLNLFSKLYRVMVQAAPEYRLDEKSLDNIFVRTSSGEMSPIGQYLKLTKVYGAESLARFNMFPAIAVNVMPADGYSSGQVIQAIREMTAQTLPSGYGYEFSGMSRDESEQGTTVIAVFIVCFLFVYLILCALYESLFIPVAVILSIPFGLAGCFLFAKLFGIENNIYMQVGLIMLIGLLAKTAILLTEYASERRRQGMSIRDAALDAARVRLRPILMTALTMVFGLLPLVVAMGVGANGYRSLAIGTVGGMIVGTLSLLFVVPVLFIIFQHLQEKVMPERKISQTEDEPKTEEV